MKKTLLFTIVLLQNNLFRIVHTNKDTNLEGSEFYFVVLAQDCQFIDIVFNILRPSFVWTLLKSSKALAVVEYYKNIFIFYFHL